MCWTMKRKLYIFRSKQDRNYIHHSLLIESLTSIPSDIGLEFLLKHRATIDEQGRLAIKDPKVQHVDITRAIFFWRLDDMHQFQRYHDSARWNIALFIALLADDRSKPEEAQPARDFAIAYLAAVLEHYDEPATFDKREAFVRLWKSCKYDFFTFSAAQKATMKKEMKQLTKMWNGRLDRLMNKKLAGLSALETSKVYSTLYGRFVGILIPGQRSYRSCGRLSPARMIEEFKRKNPISTYTLQKNALLDALNARGDDYHTPSTSNAMSAQQAAPSPVPTVSFFGYEEPSAQYLQAQYPAPVRSASDYPALHFPAVSRFDVNKNAETIVDKTVAISVLRKTKTKAILTKLLELFPPQVPTRKDIPIPEKFPAPAVPRRMILPIRPREPEIKWEDKLDKWKAESARRVAATTVVNPRTAPAPASEPLRLDQYMMDVDDSLLQTGEPTWDVTDASVPETQSSLLGGGSLFGGGG